MAIRHVGIKVRDLGESVKEYMRIGFIPYCDPEVIYLQKMERDGVIIELIEGNYDPHVSVDWFRDANGNLIEMVREDK